MRLFAAERDHVWFTAVFAAHYADVVRYVGRRVPVDAAADLAAEVFVVAWRRRREAPDECLPWLYGVARRVIANHLRSVTRFDQLAHRVNAESSSCGVHAGADVVGEQHADVSAFAAVFAQLSVDDRDVLGLVAWERLTAAQIGRVLGCSTSAATMRIHRARQRLRAALAAEPEEAR